MAEQAETFVSSYRNIRFEVVKWKSVKDYNTPYDEYQAEWIFNYYLYVPFVAIKPEDLKRFRCRREKFHSFNLWKYEKTVFYGLDWHGGLTFYEKNDYGFKVGCDYTHYFDKNYRYTFPQVIIDAHRTIDDLLDKVNLNVRCSYCGKWADKSEMYNEARCMDCKDK